MHKYRIYLEQFDFFRFLRDAFQGDLETANLPWPTLKFYYKRRTLPKHSFLLQHADYFTCKSLILPRYFNGLTLHSVKVCRSYEFSKIPPTKLRNVRSVTCLQLKAIFSNVGPNPGTNL